MFGGGATTDWNGGNGGSDISDNPIKRLTTARLFQRGADIIGDQAR